MNKFYFLLPSVISKFETWYFQEINLQYQNKNIFDSNKVQIKKAMWFLCCDLFFQLVKSEITDYFWFFFLLVKNALP